MGLPPLIAGSLLLQINPGGSHGPVNHHRA